MSRPLRILLVNKAYPPHIGGIETLVRQYARCFQMQFSAEVQVLVCQEKGKTVRETIEGVPVLRAGSIGTYFSCPLSGSFLRYSFGGFGVLAFRLSGTGRASVA